MGSAAVRRPAIVSESTHVGVASPCTWTLVGIVCFPHIPVDLRQWEGGASLTVPVVPSEGQGLRGRQVAESQILSSIKEMQG
jgi:hypothetical protein